MKLTLKDSGEVVILRIEDVNRFYILNNDEIFLKAMSLFNSSAQVVKIDLKGINYIDSSAFSTLLKLHRLSKVVEKKLILFNISDEAKELFDLLKLSSIFNFEPFTPLLQSA